VSHANGSEKKTEDGRQKTEFRSSGVQEFRSSGVQEFRSSGVGSQELKSQERRTVNGER